MPSIENFVKLKFYKVRRRIKKLRECGRGNPSQVETTEAWAPPKSARQSQLHVLLGQKNEVF